MKLAHAVLPLLLAGLAFADIGPGPSPDYDGGCCSIGFILAVLAITIFLKGK